MNHLEIPEKRISVYYPDCYDELTDKQAQTIGEIIYRENLILIRQGNYR
jgi:hypothetical protein